MQPASLDPPAFRRVANSAWDASQRYWRFVVVAMLALLHVAVFRGVADPWARALLLAHLGLLLLWQPFLRAEQRISAAQGFILMLVALAVGEIFSRNARIAGSRSSPYSTRRRSRRYSCVFSRKVTKFEIPTMSTPARRRSL